MVINVFMPNNASLFNIFCEAFLAIAGDKFRAFNENYFDLYLGVGSVIGSCLFFSDAPTISGLRVPVNKKSWVGL